MGTWGPGCLENDAALDFLGGGMTVNRFKKAFAEVTKQLETEIDADTAQIGLAAAECVAAMLGRHGPDWHKKELKKVAKLGAPDAELIDRARNAVSSIVLRSELLDLWAEEDYAPFNIAVTDLIDRLNPEIPYDPYPPLPDIDDRLTCVFCDQKIDKKEGVSIYLFHSQDMYNTMDRSEFCHFRCLNAALHPKHLIQRWKFTEDELKRLSVNPW